MPLFNYVNNYIPEYVKPNLKWYKRDDLMTWNDKLEYNKFRSYPKKCLKNVKVKNFDIIHSKYRKDYLQKSIKEYNTVFSDNFNKYQPQEKEKTMRYVTKSGRKDFWVLRDLTIKKFKNIKL